MPQGLATNYQQFFQVLYLQKFLYQIVFEKQMDNYDINFGFLSELEAFAPAKKN